MFVRLAVFNDFRHHVTNAARPNALRTNLHIVIVAKTNIISQAIQDIKNEPHVLIQARCQPSRHKPNEGELTARYRERKLSSMKLPQKLPAGTTNQ